jgi:hypothetical protein
VPQIYIKRLQFYPNPRERGREMGKNSKHGIFLFNRQFMSYANGKDY